MNKHLFISIFLHTFSAICIIASANAWAIDKLSVEDSQHQYHINSAPQALGFFPIPDTVDTQIELHQKDYEAIFAYVENTYINDAPLGNDSAKYNTKQLVTNARPDFTQHKRYGLFIPMVNKTNKQDWYVHISHYLIDKVDVYTKSNGLISHSSIQSTSTSSATYNINMLGRAVPIKMPEDAQTQLLIVITSHNMGLPIYIGLMSDNQYQTWKTDMDVVFILAIGIVLGFVLLALTSFVMSGDRTFFWFAVSTSLLLYFSVLRSPFGINTLDTVNGLPFWIWGIVGLLQISILLFVKSFLSITSSSTSAKAFNVAIGLIVLSVVISQFSNNALTGRLFAISSLLVVLLVISFGMVKAVKHGAIYIIFMLGWLPLAYTISKAIMLQNSSPEVGEVTLNYHNVEAPYFQVLHFFIHFVAMVVRIINIKKDKIAAQTKSNAKTTFLAQLSHDLRQPLDTMGLMLEHVTDNTKDAKNLELLVKTKQIHKSMLDTFGALMDISQLDAGKVNVNLTTVNIDAVFNELISEHEHNTHKKGLQFRRSKANLCINCDPVLLKRMLSNLISNACKYTTKGGILLSFRQREASILLQVWDTGCGISKNKEAFIFDLYEQASQQDKGQKHDGRGVGLATVKQIAELLGYTVSVNSVVNKGSVFSIYIPLPDTLLMPTPIAAKASSNKANRALGIVNGITDKALANSLNHYLSHWGYHNVIINNASSDAVNNNINDPRDLSANNSAIQTLIVFIDGDNITQLDKSVISELTTPQKVSEPDVYVGYFSVDFCASDNVKTELNKIFISPRVNVLTKPCKPAQLRAFINFVESQEYL